LTATAPLAAGKALPQDFERIFREHHELVYRTAFRITGNSEDAEDVLQTLFLRLLGREYPPDIEQNPKGYLHRSAVNISLDIIRARGRSVSGNVAAMRDTRPDHQADRQADRQKDQMDLRESVRAALAELTTKAAEMFVLHHVEGYTTTEIAKLIGTSPSAVAVMLFRARVRLKKAMRMYSGETL
jgi:RNA polymerase sigma-70 factor (ECF subfamily)